MGMGSIPDYLGIGAYQGVFSPALQTLTIGSIQNLVILPLIGNPDHSVLLKKQLVYAAGTLGVVGVVGGGVTVPPSPPSGGTLSEGSVTLLARYSSQAA